METNTITTVEMTAEERAQYEAFKADKEKKAIEAKRKQDLEAYDELVNETIDRVMPSLVNMSSTIGTIKTNVMNEFRNALRIKGELYDVKEQQRTHTFTNADSTKRVTLGHYVTDGWRDTVDEGIAKVRQAIESLGKDKESKALVQAVLRLLSKDQKGTLKASRVLQLRKLAEDSGNEDFINGVQIIQDSYQPSVSKQFIRAEIKDETTNEWVSVPLGMTEA